LHPVLCIPASLSKVGRPDECKLKIEFAFHLLPRAEPVSLDVVQGAQDNCYSRSLLQSGIFQKNLDLATFLPAVVITLPGGFPPGWTV
jgi:hypothetical protein